MKGAYLLPWWQCNSQIVATPSLLSWLTIKIALFSEHVKIEHIKIYVLHSTHSRFPVTKLLGDSFDKKLPISKRIGKLI